MPFNKLYDNVCVFNDLAENKNSLEGFKAQVKVLNEEVNKELFPAVDNNNIIEILDGAIDTIYVAMGFLQKLEELGVDVKGAIQQVADDNLKKFPVKVKDAVDSILFYNNKGVNVHYLHNEKYNVYVIKDENQKVKKPYNFKATDLKGYVPVELQLKGLV